LPAISIITYCRLFKHAREGKLSLIITNLMTTHLTVRLSL